MSQIVDTIFESGFIITMDDRDRILEKGYMVVHQGEILDIGPMSSFSADAYKAKKIIDCSSKVLAPGFISTHTHLFQTLLKGLGRDRYLLDWLDASVRKAFHCYDEQIMQAAALAGLCDNLRSGTTTVMDFQYCHARPGIDFAVVRAFEQLGMRGVIASARTNVAGFPPEMACDYVETEKQYFQGIRKLKQYCDDKDRLSVALAPGIIWDMTKEGYLEIRRTADDLDVPITMHVVETKDDDDYCLEAFGTDTISFLEDCGLLGPDFSLVHAVCLTDKSIEQLVRSGSTISHCPAANMILGSGRAPIPELQEKGLTISIGCDGPASNDNQDMLESIKLMALQHKMACKDPSVMPAYEALKIATIHGAKVIGQDDRIGSLEAGKEADFFIYDPRKDTAAMPIHDPVSTLVYSSTSRGMESVYVHGEALMSDGKIPRESEILHEAQVQANRLIKEAGLEQFKQGWIR